MRAPFQLFVLKITALFDCSLLSLPCDWYFLLQLPSRCTSDSAPCQVHSRFPMSSFAYFAKYFPEPFWKLCAEQTNLYSVQMRDHRSVRTSPAEMKKLAGIHMLMGLLGLPRARLYWSRISAVPLVTENMTRDRFFELRGMLHFVDLSQTTDAQT